MQTVYVAIGDPVSASDIQGLLMALADPGILLGMQLTTTASDIVTLQPGTALTDSGYLIEETEAQNINFTLSVQPQNFTVLYSYTPSNTFGGSTASLQLVPGFIPAQGYVNGVVLGWIKYPGGSVALNATQMFLAGPRIHLTPDQNKLKGNFQYLYSPLVPKSVVISTTGVPLSVTDQYNATVKAPVLTIQNSSGGVSRAIYYVPFTVPFDGLGNISIQAQADNGSLLSVTIVDALGNQYTPDQFSQITNVTMQTFVYTMSSASVIPGNTQAYFQLSFEINPGFTTLIQALGFSSYTDPF